MRMRCAGESWGGTSAPFDFDKEYPERPFTQTGEGEWTCTHCGWIQSSFEGGIAELCTSATWHDAEAYAQHAAVARAAGFDVPRLPPNQES